MKIVDYLLPPTEFYNKEHPKNMIVLHHTAGGHRPDWTSQMWGRDDRGRVATAYVVGGKSTRDANTDWDGVIVKCFDDTKCGYHIGALTADFNRAGIKPIYRTRTKDGKKIPYPANDEILVEKSIGIEICSYGCLSMGRDGKFYTYVNSVVPESDVIELSTPFRGYKYFHKYTDRQIDSLFELLKDIIKRHNINPKKGIIEGLTLSEDQNQIKRLQVWANFCNIRGLDNKPLIVDGIIGNNTKTAIKNPNLPFEYNPYALGGEDGIYSHTSFRLDKNDVYPHPKLIEMLKSL